ncbi:hypothetical protein [Bacillus sp. THAF10]|uniref:nucleotidyltransferase domain-containing protein n=1 Tax=Bacillus sp. THAF10 TaxID=2587848 RepID=UPI001C12A4B9|nr:hypothetical protein [Bacillus sp. THAF10]
MNSASFKWWIAGGWALDLYVGRKTREHGDTDIVILKQDQMKLQKLLEKDWELYIAHKGALTLWQAGEQLEPHYDNLWAKRKTEDAWSLQIMLFDHDEVNWIYKREKSIRKPWTEIGEVSSSGIPYLRPEIQLLYKGGSSVLRKNDEQDLETVLPLLDGGRVQWLYEALSSQFPRGHEWLNKINACKQKR